VTAERADVSIRPERPGDAHAIRRVNDAAFGGTIEGQIVDDLRGTEDWIDGGSLVAVDLGDRVVGHLLLSRGTLEAEDGSTRPMWVIGPVAVEPEQQGRGIGTALMRAAIALATERGQPLICLLGHAGYYPRFGFEPARGIGLEAPHPWPDANWMALRLPTWTAGLRGVVRFPRAFPAE
jgi:predicted N-acetyltransferase YhbS